MNINNEKMDNELLEHTQKIILLEEHLINKFNNNISKITYDEKLLYINDLININKNNSKIIFRLREEINILKNEINNKKLIINQYNKNIEDISKNINNKDDFNFKIIEYNKIINIKNETIIENKKELNKLNLSIKNLEIKNKFLSEKNVNFDLNSIIKEYLNIINNLIIDKKDENLIKLENITEYIFNNNIDENVIINSLKEINININKTNNYNKENIFNLEKKQIINKYENLIENLLLRKLEINEIHNNNTYTNISNKTKIIINNYISNIKNEENIYENNEINNNNKTLKKLKKLKEINLNLKENLINYEINKEDLINDAKEKLMNMYVDNKIKLLNVFCIINLENHENMVIFKQYKSNINNQLKIFSNNYSKAKYEIIKKNKEIKKLKENKIEINLKNENYIINQILKEKNIKYINHTNINYIIQKIINLKTIEIKNNNTNININNNIDKNNNLSNNDLFSFNSHYDNLKKKFNWNYNIIDRLILKKEGDKIIGKMNIFCNNYIKLINIIKWINIYDNSKEKINKDNDIKLNKLDLINILKNFNNFEENIIKFLNEKYDNQNINIEKAINLYTSLIEKIKINLNI